MSRATLILLSLAAGLLIGVGAAALAPAMAAGAVFVARLPGVLAVGTDTEQGDS